MSAPVQTIDKGAFNQPAKSDQRDREAISPNSYLDLAQFRSRYWLIVPLLALATYVTVLNIGFLGDDFVLSAQADWMPIFKWALPQPETFLYRPVGLLLVWKLGVALWGFNPLPFHIQSLLLHAAVSLVLALWLTEATSNRLLGWLAGALFAVYPLHLEAVGWIAAQWDVLSTLFALLSLWFFTRWWRQNKTTPTKFTSRRTFVWYGASVLFFSLALFAKDSLLSFLPLFALSVWLGTPKPVTADWRRLFISLVPLLIVLLINLGIRYLTWGNFGGYPGLQTNGPVLFLDTIIIDLCAMIAPINASELGPLFAQIVGAISLSGLLLGVVLFGRQWWRLLVVCSIWIVVTLVPVNNLPVSLVDLQQNRVLYLPAIGYCIAVAALFYSVLRVARQTSGWRFRLAAGSIALLLVFCAGVTWLQLRPWHTASVQSMDMERELLRLIPPPDSPRTHAVTWWVAGLPHDYKGAYLPHLALGSARYFIGNKDVPATRAIASPTDFNFTSLPESFVVSIGYDDADAQYHVNTASGITTPESSPPREGGYQLTVWDFTSCAPTPLGDWQVLNAQATCEQGRANGLIVRRPTADAQLIGPRFQLQTLARGARFLRIRVSIRYPAIPQPTPVVSEWFWADHEETWTPDHSQALPVRQVGVPEEYWTFVPISKAGEVVTQLRFDPADAPVASAIQWIAIDFVK